MTMFVEWGEVLGRNILFRRWYVYLGYCYTDTTILLLNCYITECELGQNYFLYQGDGVSSKKVKTGGIISSFKPEEKLDKEINMWNKLSLYLHWYHDKVKIKNYKLTGTEADNVM